MACLFGHTWDTWQIIKEAPIERTKDKQEVGYFLIQKRSCILCGKTELNKQQRWI